MLIIGHRGARGLAPENTIEAIEAGYSAGAKMVEIDVRVTSDNIAVLCHDEFISSKQFVVADITFKELGPLNPELATLEDALRAAADRPLMIEIKPGVNTAPVLEILSKNRLSKKHMIASFDSRVLEAVHHKLPDTPLIVLEKWSGVRAGHRARKLGTKRITMNQKWLWSGFIRSVSKRGWILGTYTLNDPAKARRWEKYGLQAVVTDYPDRFSGQ